MWFCKEALTGFVAGVVVGRMILFTNFYKSGLTLIKSIFSLIKSIFWEVVTDRVDVGVRVSVRWLLMRGIWSDKTLCTK